MMTGMFLLVFIGTALMIPGMIDDVDIIKQRMMSLGFLECKIGTQDDRSYLIRVNAYAQSSQALSLDTIFRPFEVRAKYNYGTLYLEKADIKRAGFIVDAEYLPRGVTIVRLGIAMRSPQRQMTVGDSSIQRIERALKETKRNRRKVYANCKTAVTNLNQTFSMMFPDVCKTPSGPAGPIPIPYPNFSKSSDTAAGAKKVKADKAAAIAKESHFKKSEGDEVGTQSKKLQKAFRQIIAKRELNAEEKASFRRDLRSCLDKATLLMKTLDKYVEVIQKLLRQDNY